MFTHRETSVCKRRLPLQSEEKKKLLEVAIRLNVQYQIHSFLKW